MYTLVHLKCKLQYINDAEENIEKHTAYKVVEVST